VFGAHVAVAARSCSAFSLVAGEKAAKLGSVSVLLQALARLVAIKRLGVLLFVLLAALCATNTASAHERPETKTRVRDFELAQHHSHGLSLAAKQRKASGKSRHWCPNSHPIHSYRWRDPSGRDAIDDLQSGLDTLAGLPIIGDLFAGPAAWGHGFRNRNEGILKLSRDETFAEGECQLARGNAQIAAGGEATAALGAILVGAAELAEKAGGIVYLRRDTVGLLKDYVGQAESEVRFSERQLEHAADHPASSFEFTVLDRSAPGDALNVAEESWIRAGGGPTNKANPDGGLSNARHQMNDADYRNGGGNVPWP
jgi:hypothetical protein